MRNQAIEFAFIGLFQWLWNALTSPFVEMHAAAIHLIALDLSRAFIFLRRLSAKCKCD